MPRWTASSRSSATPYSALYDESSASRTELMEFLIIVLIMAEIVIALVRP